jgi:hypothetical protein
MEKTLQAVAQAIKDGDLKQELKERLKNHPVIHFSENAEKIMTEGFLFGERSTWKLDCTYENGAIKQHSGPGYNFAFNTVEWDYECDGMDYEVCGPNSQRGITGMYAESAVLFNVDGLYTHHYDEFHQVVFWGPDAKLNNAILLKNTGTIEIDGDEACDENGNPVHCWTAKTASGEIFVQREEMMNLRECVIRSLIRLDQEKQLSAKGASAYKEAYQDEIEEMGLSETVAAIPSRERKRKTSEYSEMSI